MDRNLFPGPRGSVLGGGLAFLFSAVELLAQANSGVILQIRLEKNKPFYQVFTTETDQDMKVMNQESRQTYKQTFYFAFEPEGKDMAGDWVLRQKIIAIKFDFDIGGNRISYDSTQPVGPQRGDFLKPLIGAEFRIRLGPNLRIRKIEGQENLLKKLAAQNRKMEPYREPNLKSILNEDALKQMAAPMFDPIPDRPVLPGDSWTRQNSLDLGPIGRFVQDFRFTYEGQFEKLDRIKSRVRMRYETPADPKDGNMPFTITKADLKSEEGLGTVWFDREAGRMASSEMTVTLKGSLTIDVAGMETSMELRQTQKTSMKCLDRNPLK